MTPIEDLVVDSCCRGGVRDRAAQPFRPSEADSNAQPVAPGGFKMSTIEPNEGVDQRSRRFLGATAMAVVALELGRSAPAMAPTP